MKKTFGQWKKIAKKVAGIQASIFLIIFYCIFLVPLSIVFKIFFPSMFTTITASNRKANHWIKKEQIKKDLLWAKKQ